MRCLQRPILCILFILIVTLSWGQDRKNLNDLHKRLLTSDSIQLIKISAFRKVTNSRFRPLDLDKSFLLTGITQNGIPVYKAPLNAGAAITTGVNELQNESLGINLQGENITVGVWDDGFVKDHIEFDNRILTKEGVTSQLHATHVTGTILAKGIDPLARGMASKASATTWYFDNDEAEMAAVASTDQTGLLFSNHSYGIVTGWTKVGGAWVWTGDVSISTNEDYRHGFYGDDAQTIDQIAFNAPYYTIVWAAGNDRAEIGNGTYPADGNGGTGYDCIIPQSVAKNIITVGAVSKIPTYTDASSVVMSNFSSWGPTDDGRVKPDLVGAGINIYSTSSAGTNLYATLNGTSMATPNVTGSLALIQELYSKLNGGNYMKASTLKALAIHTAKEAGSFPGPDYNFGWGLLDVQKAANTLLHNDGRNIIITEQRIENGESYSLDLFSQANQKITVTLCWTDPPGTPAAAALDPTNLMLVNDLDVRIIDALGNEQLPWILNPGIPTNKATQGDNFRDNVEKIEFNNPSAKRYTITIKHKGSLVNNVQDFSLVVTCKSTLSSGLTYYWIGNSGNWSDGSHWSLSSGGVATGVVPTSSDNVIVDDNSFDGLSLRSVTLSADVSCHKMTILTDREAELVLNNHQLLLNDNFLISADNFKISSDGVLNFKSAGTHFINIHKGNLSKASLEFNGGSWLVRGKLNIKKMSLKKDSLSIGPDHHSIRELNASLNTTLNLQGSIIDSLGFSTLASINLFSGNASITVSEGATLNWDVNYSGKLTVPDEVSLMMTGTDTIQSLQLGNSSVFKIANGLTQYLSELGVSGAGASLSSDSKASINLLTHNKLCFDNINVTNVDVVGNSIVNAGSNSTIVNSNNWVREQCDQILFPDFEIMFTCENGYTSFIDKSEGAVISWNWNFGDDQSGSNTSIKQNAFHSFSHEGVFPVSLTISDGATNRTYTQDIIIGTNALGANTIVYNGTSLMSFLISDNYQWYNNEELIDGATSRSYNYQGDIGSFVVVINSADCNLASQPYLITGVEYGSNGILISPNPAHDFIHISSTKPNIEVSMADALGCSVMEIKTFENEITLDIKHLTSGIYILQIQSDGYLIQRKVLISR